MRINVKDVGKRLRQIRGELSLVEFEPIVGISRNMISQYERGEAWPKPDTLNNYAEHGKVSFGWILSGEEPGSSVRNNIEVAQGGIPEGYVKAEVFHMAGAGLPNLAAEQEPIETIYLPQNLLKPAIVPIKVSGRSMEPMIVNGAIVGVDREDVKIVSGEIYAVWLPYEGAVVKRIYMTTNGIILRSDNPAFPELTIPVSEIGEDHLILGRVKWVLQEF